MAFAIEASPGGNANHTIGPVAGILTAIIAGFIISALGGSRVQIGGPTGAFIVIIYGVVAQFGITGLMLATIMAGFFLVLLGLFRLGTIIKFIPYPIVVGFTSGDTFFCLCHNECFDGLTTAQSLVCPIYIMSGHHLHAPKFTVLRQNPDLPLPQSSRHFLELPFRSSGLDHV